MKPLGPRFFARAALEVARDLLGATLRVRGDDGQWTAGRIVETEAYGGPEDEASHARGGRTPRSTIMFGPPGVAYIYLVYGMHHCLNFVTETEGQAGAVLVRAIEPVTGVALMAQRRGLDPARCRPRDLTAGPGRLCQALGLDLSWNGMPVATREPAAGSGRSRVIAVYPASVRVAAATGPRIGLTRGAEAPHRFMDPASDCLSR